MRVHRLRANPVQCDKVPGQRSGHGSDVDRAGRSAVPEVGERQVEEVDDDEQLGEPEVRADPQVQETEEKEVRRDVVGADVGGCIDVHGIFRIERVGVDELQEKDDNPVLSCQ